MHLKSSMCDITSDKMESFNKAWHYYSFIIIICELILCIAFPLYLQYFIMFDDVHCKSSFGNIFQNGNRNIVLIHCHSIAYCPLPSSPVNGTLGKEWTTKHFASRTVNRGLSMFLSADLVQWSLLWLLLFGPMNQHVLAVDFLNEWATCVYVAERAGLRRAWWLSSLLNSSRNPFELCTDDRANTPSPETRSTFH